MNKFLLSLLTAGVIFTSCKNVKEENPLLVEWNTPFGIPPFEQVKAKHYMPAFKAAMDAEMAEIYAITANTDQPTFANTIEAFDNTGELYSKVSGVFGSDNGVNSTDSLRNIAKELSPIQSAHSSAIRLNDTLFQRIKYVYDNKDSLGLDANQLRLTELVYKSFANNGANLPADKKEELKKLNAQISALQLEFGQNLLQETAAFNLVIDNESDLKGLTPNQIAEAAKRAEKAGQAGKWMFGLDNPSIMPFLANSDNRDLRKQMLDAYLNRGNNGNEQDNKEIIKKLIDLRLKRAQLMGYETAADFILEDRMAKTPGAVYELLGQIWTPALKVAASENKDMQSIMKAEGVNTPLEAYDWRYYAQKAMNQKFNLSESEMAPYFMISNVRDGIFYVSNKLYGINFKKLENVPLPNQEAEAFEVTDKDGSLLGVVFFDMFARPGEKRGGAWCGGFRSQKYKNGERVAPLVTIVGNFTRPVGDEPALLTTDEVETYFHEFGHGLASLLKNVKYSGLGGYPRDFVELPSQILEHWAFQPEVLKVYAKHYKTGDVIPNELVAKMEKAGKYGQGFATVEYLGASYLDMDFHTLKSIPEGIDVIAFESNDLYGNRKMTSQIPPRYRSTYFNHTFTGGYTAGYYSYIWAEVLDADAFQAFTETGDIFNQEVSNKFRKEILERAGEADAMDLYTNFRGSKPGIKALLSNRGLN